MTLSVVQDPFFVDPSPHPSPVISNILAQSEGKSSVLPIFDSVPLSIDRHITPASMEVATRHPRIITCCRHRGSTCLPRHAWLAMGNANPTPIRMPQLPLFPLYPLLELYV